MVDILGTTFAVATEVKRGHLVRRVASWRVVVDVVQIEDGIRLHLDDGSTLTLGREGMVEVAR